MGGGRGEPCMGVSKLSTDSLFLFFFLDTSEFKGNLKRGNMVDDRANE